MESIFNLIVFIVILVVVFNFSKKGQSGNKIFNNIVQERNNLNNKITNNIKDMLNKLSKKAGLVIVGVITIILIFNAFVIIPAGTVGVVHLFGKVSDNELQSGFNAKNPLSMVTKMSIRTEEYTMSVVSDGKKASSDSISALTKEGLSVNLDITVLYHLDPQKASEVYKEIGVDYQGKIIRPQVRTAIRDVVAIYQAKDIYSEKRDEVTNKISEKLSSLSDRGIVLEQVLLRNVRLPAELSKSIEAKLTAEQDIERKGFEVEVAKKEADRKQAEAEGIKKSQEIISNSLSQAYLRWYSIEMMRDLAGSPNTTFLFVPTDSSGTPIVNIMPRQ